MSKVIQPNDIFKLLKVKDTEEAEKVLSTTLEFLVYLRPGDILKTSTITFEKLSEDLIHIDTTIQLDEVLDDLAKKRIVRLPV